MTSPYEADPDKIPAADLYADVPCYGRYCPKPDDFHVDHQHVNSQGPESLTYWASVIDICTEENRIYPADAGDRDVFALGSTIVKSSHLHATGDTQSPEIDFSYADANEIKAITLAKTVLSDIKVPEIYFAGKIHGRQVLVQERLPGVGLSVAWPYLSREQKKSYKEQARKTLHQLHTVKPAQRLKARSHVVMDPNILSNGRINPLEGAIIFSVANHDPDISFMHNDFTVSNCIVNNDAIVGLIDIQFFWEEYRRFWAQPQSTSTHFLMKLVLILALGTTFYPDRSNRMHLRRLAHTWIYAVQWWLVGPSEKSTVNLDGLQVGCLLLLARQTNSLPGTSWLSAGSVLRMAMAMGLLRSPELFPVLSVYQSEMRARLWATVLELTLLSMLDAAMPLPFSLQDIDCTAPSNLDDEQFGPETEMLPTPQSSKRLTDSSIQVLLFKSLPVRVEVVWLLNNQHHQELSYETALRLGNELRSACRDLASFFGTSRNQSRHAGRTPGMTNFHLRFLDTYLRRYILFLYRPFMIQARKDPRFYLSRKLCLESCIVVASYADHLNLPSDALDDLSHLTIVGRGSFKGALSFDVITSLGLEIITQLEEEASTRPLGSSPPFVADSMDELAKAHRAPLIRSLEHIQEQLLQIIALGNPSLKRYNFLSAILSQIRAMESGQPIQPAIYETIKESLKNCYVLLEASHTASSPQDSVESLTTGPDSLPGFDLDALDPALGLEIPSLLFFPGVMGTSSIEWSGIDVNKQPWNATTEP